VGRRIFSLDATDTGGKGKWSHNTAGVAGGRGRSVQGGSRGREKDKKDKKSKIGGGGEKGDPSITPRGGEVLLNRKCSGGSCRPSNDMALYALGHARFTIFTGSSCPERGIFPGAILSAKESEMQPHVKGDKFHEGKMCAAHGTPGTTTLTCTTRQTS